MTLCDYFSAVDDQAALAVADRPGGPASTVIDVVFLKGIDPVVPLAQLEAILTDCSYEEASERPRSGQLLPASPDYEAVIVSVSDTLAEALAIATQAEIAYVAELWSMTPELQQSKVSAAPEFEASLSGSIVGHRALSWLCQLLSLPVWRRPSSLRPRMR
ncbi:hypothetical protein [Kitasatospora cinereorecta]|uniref:Uncharacterized protein n=1 Tax=Kitasatospora cinereorecta TaxID=285560 RepID=A0ABW0VR14_9ACTN